LFHVFSALLFCRVSVFREEVYSRKKAQKAQKSSLLSGVFLRLLRLFAALWLGDLVAAQPR